MRNAPQPARSSLLSSFTICSWTIQMYWASDTKIRILIQKEIQMLIINPHSCFPTTSCRTIQIHYPLLLTIHTHSSKCIWPKSEMFSKQLAGQLTHIVWKQSRKFPCHPKLPRSVSPHLVPNQWARLTLSPNDIGSVTVASLVEPLGALQVDKRAPVPPLSYTLPHLSSSAWLRKETNKKMD